MNVPIRDFGFCLPTLLQKRFAPWRLKFFVNFVRKRAAVYSCGTQSELPRERTEKVISNVVSDGEWKLYPYYITNSARLQYLREKYLAAN